MAKLPSNKIDVIVTDPPFAIDFKSTKANYNRTAGLVLDGYEDIPADQYDFFTYRWLKQCYRILKNSGSAYVFSGYNNLETIIHEARRVGFHLTNQIIWKYQFGVVTKNKYVTSHYNILFLTKRRRKYKFYPNSRFKDTDKTPEGRSKRYADMEDVWIIPREYWTGKEKTPTKLPAAVVEKPLAYSSKKGDLVFDPFMGSGQVAYVAKKMGRNYLGYEIVKDYCKFARKRLARRSN